jgi:hypothetical protein
MADEQTTASTTATATTEATVATTTQAATTAATEASTTTQTTEQTETTAAATEVKTEATKTEATAEAKTDAPVVYDIKAPEGVVLDDKVIGDLKSAATDLKLSPEQAQGLVDKMAPVIAAQQAEAFTQIHKGWVETAKADKEIGGAKFEENLGIAKTALDKFATPEFKQFLNMSKLGDHPEMLRAFHRIGLAIAEDKFVPGTRAAKANAPLEERAAKALYGSSTH